MSEQQQTQPTEAEIAAAHTICNVISAECVSPDLIAFTIARHNAPLHAQISDAVIELKSMHEVMVKSAKDYAKIISDQRAQIAKQKAALELAQKALQDKGFYISRIGGRQCLWCGELDSVIDQGIHRSDCQRELALAAIKEALS